MSVEHREISLLSAPVVLKGKLVGLHWFHIQIAEPPRRAGGGGPQVPRLLKRVAGAGCPHLLCLCLTGTRLLSYRISLALRREAGLCRAG
jgi:hypothetical protein